MKLLRAIVALACARDAVAGRFRRDALSLTTLETYGTSERPFAETVNELKMQLMNARTLRGEKSYNNDDMVKIMKAARFVADYSAGAWRLSGKTSLNHGVGTASCMLHANAPADYVSLAVAHGVYFSKWRENFKDRSQATHPKFQSQPCPKRQFVSSVMGADVEHALWRYYSLWGSKPDSGMHKLMLRLYGAGHVTTQDKYIFLFDLCDEAEQYQSKEQLWVGDDRKRDQEFYDLYFKLLDTLSHDPDLPRLRMDVLRNFAREQFAYVQRTFHGPCDEACHQERSLRDVLEGAFQGGYGSDKILVNWAHYPDIQKNKETCYHQLDVCVQHWQEIVGFWEGFCCPEGICPNGSHTRAVPLPHLLWSLGAPPLHHLHEQTNSFQLPVRKLAPLPR